MAGTVSVSTNDVWADRAFWRDFAPSLGIERGEMMGSTKLFNIAPDHMAGLQTLMRQEGYFQMPPVDWQLPMQEMVSLIARLDADGIPVPFAFVYDEFWLMFVKLHEVIGGLLGPGYLRLPDFWVWFVDPHRDDAGWKPHRDKTFGTLREDGSPKSLTVWIPLSDATTLNGCMYIVPADRDPTYNTQRQNEWTFAHQDIRALPAQAGSILMWNKQVLHWGSHGSPRETRPRVSAAFEFQAGDVPPYNQPLMSPTSIPNFNSRLGLIAKQILQYQHMYPLSAEVKAIAQRISSANLPR